MDQGPVERERSGMGARENGGSRRTAEIRRVERGVPHDSFGSVGKVIANPVASRLLLRRQSQLGKRLIPSRLSDYRQGLLQLSPSTEEDDA
jgi:hypothetical protein